jgi:hypothetical protein
VKNVIVKHQNEQELKTTQRQKIWKLLRKSHLTTLIETVLYEMKNLCLNKRGRSKIIIQVGGWVGGYVAVKPVLWIA